MHWFLDLLPQPEYIGVWTYLLVLVIALVESLAFVGSLFPGSILLLLVGFLSATGQLDMGILIASATVGAIIGDNISYYLGRQGMRFFKEDSKLLAQGCKFFVEHGSKSVFLGRFLGVLRAIVPFIAGLMKMSWKTFMFWNVTSAVIWAALYILVGYGLAQILPVDQAIRLGERTLWILTGLVILGILVFARWRYLKFKRSNLTCPPEEENTNQK